MRRITIILISIAVMAFVSACNMNLTVEGPGKGFVRKTIHLSASEIITSKAIFGEKEDTAYPMLWQEGDVVYVSVNGAAACSKELAADDIKAGGRAADFGLLELDLPKEGAITIKVTTNTNAAGTSATIKYSPSDDKCQSPQETSCDPSCVVLFATASYDSAGSVPETLDLRFSHTTAYGLMSISGITLGGSETIKFVELQSMSTAVKIAGNVTLDDKGSLSGAGYTSMTLKGIEDLGKPIWFAIAPAVFESANALAIHVVTSDDNHYEKILDCSTNNLEFQAGHVSKFGVNFSGISSAPRQVKTARDLVLLKNALNNSDYGYWVNSDDEIMLANDIDYNNDAVSGNKTTLPAGVTFNGQNHAIQNATISATIFKTVAGTVKNLSIEGGTGSTNLFETVSGKLDYITISDFITTAPLINSVESTGIIDHLTVDDESSYTCSAAENMGFVTLSNAGLIQNSTVEATITVEDPLRAAFNFGVFSPKCTSGRFYKCVNKSDVTIETSTNVNGCSLGGIVGVIESTQPNEIDGKPNNILDECSNEGEITLTLNLPESGYHRNCSIGGIAGGDYKGGTGNSGVWKALTYSSSGVIYKCINSGPVTINFNSPYPEISDKIYGSGVSLGGVVGATINDLKECTNEGSVTANLNVSTPSRKCGAPKIGGVVGAAHNKVISCVNESTASVSVNGSFRNVNGNLYAGTGPINQACIGGVAGCVGCGGSSAEKTDEAASNSDSAGSEIVNCTNKTSSLTPPDVTTPGSPCFGKVCGWTSAYNTGNVDEGGKEDWEVIGTSVASTPSTAAAGSPLPK